MTSKYDAIILDIEGTTTPISFVKEVLFPYAADNIADYVDRHNTTRDAEYVSDINALMAQSQIDRKSDSSAPIITSVDDRDGIIAVVTAAIRADRKTTSLKSLQGHIWREGYRSGKLIGTMYDDTYTALRDWTEAGVRVYIYSSGSVDAQKLIFGYTDRGSLLEYISGHFDTEVGAKQEDKSYRTIMERIEVTPSRCLFCTDVYGEAAAMIAAGGAAVLMLRPGNASLPENNAMPTAKTFTDIKLTRSQT